MIAMIVAGSVYAMLQQEAVEARHRAAERDQRMLDDVLLGVRTAESSQRGFLLTEDERYLRLFDTSLSRVNVLIATLDTTLSRAGSINRVASAVKRKAAELRHTIALSRRGEGAEALRIVTTDIGLGHMHDIEAGVAALRRQTEEAIGREDASLARMHLTINILRVLLVLGLLLLLLYIYRTVAPLLKQLESNVGDLRTEVSQRQSNEVSNLALIDDLRQRNLDLDHFAYIASHDLQEPLRTISNFVGVIREEQGSKLDAEAHSYFDFIERAASRMRLLINNLLRYSRIGRELEMETVDLNEVLEEVLESLSAHIEQSGAKVTRSSLPELPGYRIELSQLFQNLISNALKFHKPGSPPRIDLYSTADEVSYRISVEDQGIGMTEDEQAKIFMMFTQLHNRNAYEGQGIGLAFCKKIVELHHGRLLVDSTPGRGSTFTIVLPRTVTYEDQARQSSDSR